MSALHRARAAGAEMQSRIIESVGLLFAFMRAGAWEFASRALQR